MSTEQGVLEQNPDYDIRIISRAKRDLDRFPHVDYKRIDKHISSLTQNPRPAGVIKLWDKEPDRMRVDPWRIIYFIDDENRFVDKIVRREKDTYR